MVSTKNLLSTVLLGSIMLVPALASTQDLLSNRHFEADLTDWIGSGWWSSEDCFSDIKSGSATYINQLSGTSAWYIARQCVELPSVGEAYDLSGYLFVPTGQSGVGWGKLGLVWHSLPACDPAGFIDGNDAPHAYANSSWQTRSIRVVAPDTAVSVFVTLINQKTSEGGVFQVYADELSLVELDKIFADGFESSDTTEWSSSVP
jgi:hypothetical protein